MHARTQEPLKGPSPGRQPNGVMWWQKKLVVKKPSCTGLFHVLKWWPFRLCENKFKRYSSSSRFFTHLGSEPDPKALRLMSLGTAPLWDFTLGTPLLTSRMCDLPKNIRKNIFQKCSVYIYIYLFSISSSNVLFFMCFFLLVAKRWDDPKLIPSWPPEEWIQSCLRGRAGQPQRNNFSPVGWTTS